MRYIADSNGYLQEISFGADILCNGQGCREYTGGVPFGYSSLMDWFSQECDKLYRWQIKSGELSLDHNAKEPPTYPATQPTLIPLTQDEYDALVDANQVDATALYLIVRDV